MIGLLSGATGAAFLWRVIKPCVLLGEDVMSDKIVIGIVGIVICGMMIGTYCMVMSNCTVMDTYCIL